ncbi:MAG: SpoIID/LytB domain-containing protein [Planctomycetota bacterium]
MTPDNPEPARQIASARQEPTLRIGVILDQDELVAVRLTLPGAPYRLTSMAAPGAGAPSSARVSAGPSQLTEPRASLTIRLTGSELLLELPAAALRASAVRLACPAPPPLERGGGVLVEGVPAGRGFHWQKHVDQTLPGTLELRPGRRGIVLINELPLEEYLAGVITAEMSSACPLEFLKAQCIVARSWLLAMTEPKHAGEGFDRCNDDCCQRYQGTGDLGESTLAAVQATRGRILRAPTGGVLDANYAKSCGGITETPWAVWGLDKPGIRPIVDAPPDAPERRLYPVTDANIDEYLDGAWLPTARCYCSPNVVAPSDIGRYLGRVDKPDDYFRWTVRYTRNELETLLRGHLSEPNELAELCDLRVRARGASGRAYAVETEWRDPRGAVVIRRIDGEYRIRQVLHRKFLYSSAFAVRTKRDAAGGLRTVTLRGAGWGHGVGMCQIGALGMALTGENAEAICAHYYPAATLARLYL